MNPFSPAIFAESIGCLPCCGTPTECACALLIPPFDVPYADYATAETAIADQVTDCLGYIAVPPLTTIDSFSVGTGTPNALEVDSAVTGTGQGVSSAWVSMTVADGSTLDIDYNVSSSGVGDDFNEVEVNIFDCNGVSVFGDTNSGSSPVSGTFSYGPITTGGVYYVQCVARGQTLDEPTDPSTTTASFTVASDATAVGNPVIALWDDSGTTRQLEACPKFLMPPFTEAFGDWYASCADAETSLANPLQFSNCIGFVNSPADVDGFTATDGGTSLTFNSTSSMTLGGGLIWLGSVNGEAGETLSFAISSDGGTFTGTADIFDYAGTLVESVDISSGTGISSGLPYPGRYTVRITLDSFTSPWSTVTGDITSSGTITVNQIQALYDVGLDCPNRLNCGDSCP